MYYRKPDLIEEEIEDVKEIIQVNEELIPKFPDDSILKSNLKYLKERKKELIDELTCSNDHYNMDVFSITILKKNPPVKDVLELSYSLQDLFYPLAQANEGAVARGTHVPIEIKNAAMLGLQRAEAGSLTLFFKTDPLETDTQKRFFTLMRVAMDNLSVLLSSETDKELIKKQATKLGLQCIDKYRNFLGTISKQEVDINLFDIKKPKNYPTQKITKEFAQEVYQCITEINPPTEETVQIEGELGVIDTFSYKFKIKDLNDKMITIKFDEHFIESVKKRLKQIVKADVKVTKKYHEIEDKTDEERELIRFIELNQKNKKT